MSSSSSSVASAVAPLWDPPMRSDKEREAAMCACLPTDPYFATLFVEALTFAYVHSDEKTDTSTEIRFRVGRQLSTPDALRLKSVSYDRATQTFRIKLAHEYKINTAELVSFRLFATTKIRDFSSGGAYLMFEVRGEGDKPVDWLACINYWHPNNGIQIQQVKEPCWWSKGTRRVRKDWQNEEYAAQMSSLRQQWKAIDDEIALSELASQFFDIDAEARGAIACQLRFHYVIADAPKKVTHVDIRIGEVSHRHTFGVAEVKFSKKHRLVKIALRDKLAFHTLSIDGLQLQMELVPGLKPAIGFDVLWEGMPRMWCDSMWIPGKGVVPRPRPGLTPADYEVKTVRCENLSYKKGPTPVATLVVEQGGDKRKVGKDDIAEEEQIERPADVKRARA